MQAIRKLARLALLRTSVPDVMLSYLLDAERSRRVQDFHAEVNKSLRTAQFADEAALIAALSAAVPLELEKRKPPGPTVASDDPAVLAIIGKLTIVKLATDAENQTLRQRVQELENQLAAAVARTLTAVRCCTILCGVDIGR